MKFERQLDWLTVLVVLLAIVTYALASSSLLIAMIGVPAAIGAWLLGDQLRSMQMPRVVANTLVLAAVARALFAAFQRGVRVEDVCTLVVVILVIKIFDRKTARDYAQLLTLSVFLSLGAVLTSNAFLMGLTLIAMLPLVIAAATVFQLYAAWEHQGPGATQRVRVTGSSPVRDFRRLVAIGTTGAVGIAMCAFLMLPRGVGADVLGRMRAPSTGTATGFADSVDLGKAGLISESHAVVLDLALRRPDTNELAGQPGLVYYLRGSVLDDYRNGRWISTSQRSLHEQDGMSAQAEEKVRLSTVPIDTPDGAKLSQRISMRNLSSGSWHHIFSLWQPEVISFDEPAKYVRDADDKTIQVWGRGGRLDYTVVSLVTDMRRRDDDRRPRVAPVDVEGIRDVATQILRDHDIEPDPSIRPFGEDGRTVRAIQAYLQTEFTYTLDILAAPPGRDPVEWFLTERHQGHCEYFASAMALLCRSVGINANVVTGYVAAEFNTATGHYIVRESNAHAWVEVEHSPGQWTRYDPTPPADLDRIHRPNLGFGGRLKQWFNALEYAWINSVVSYDQRPHSRIDRASRPETETGLGAVGRMFRNLHDGGMELWFRALLIGVMVFAACAAVLTIVEMAYRWLHAWLGARRARQRAERLDPELPRRLEQMAVYAELLRAMSKAGQTKPRYLPPREHTEAIEGIDPVAAAAARRVVDLFYRVRFGHEVLTSEQMEDASAGVRAYQEAVRRR